MQFISIFSQHHPSSPLRSLIIDSIIEIRIENSLEKELNVKNVKK